MEAKNFSGRISTDKVAYYGTTNGNIITLYLIHRFYPEEFDYFYELKINGTFLGRYLAGATFEEAVETVNILIEYM